MANVWAGDPNIISVWNFESGALNTDSGGAGNTLTAVNTPAEDVVDYKQGTCCTSLAYASKRYFKIADASLSAGFPLKVGDTVQRVSMGCWFKLASTGGNVPNIIGKNTYAGAGLSIYHNAGSLRVAWNGTNLGPTLALSTGVWYHMVICADGRARTCYGRLYDSSTGIATSYIWAPPAADLTLTSEWRIGAWSGTDADRTFDGKIDEAFVFSRLLSYAEIDAIRNGSFEYAAAPTVANNDFTRDLSCLSLYRFESGALTTDTKGLINLTASATAPIVNTVDFKVGSGCAQFSYGLNSYYSITDTNLPVAWPMKSGYSNRAFTVCCWVKGFDHGSTTRTIWAKWLANNLSFILYVSSSTRTFHVAYGFQSNSSYDRDTGIAFLPNEWYHIGIIVDGGTTKDVNTQIFLDSTSTAYRDRWTPTTTQMNIGTADFKIGTNPDGVTQNWNGLIDDFVVFNRALCTEEISAIKDGTYKGPISPDTPYVSHVPALLTFAQAVNNPGLQFIHGGDAVWSIENNETHDGGFAVKSGTLAINQESWFSTTVRGPGTLLFWWAVDSTADHHYLQFQIDDVEQHKISGPNNPGAWALKTYSITAGTHTLKWRYYTDGTATSNRNAGWVDEISFGRANDFTGDTTCKALYNFDCSTTLGKDSISTNHLLDQNGVDINYKRYKTGFQCADLNRNNLTFFLIPDASLAADFPLKNGDATKTGTFCFWIYFKALSSNTYYDLLTKGSLSARCFDLYYYNTIKFNWGYSGGNQDIDTGWSATTLRWYHFSVSFDGANKRVYLRIWDDEIQQVVCDQVWSPINAMVTSTGPFSIGLYSGGANTAHALFDEVVVFNRQLPIWQMDAIRKGLYSSTGPTQPGNDFSADSTCKALWRFEAGALTVDSKSTNTLTDHSTVSITNIADTVREGSGCVKTTNSAATWLHIADSSLAADFPLKNGDATKVISVCCWFRPFDYGNYRTLIAKRSWSANKGSFVIVFDSSNRLGISYVYGSGTITTQEFQIGTGMSTYVWYHLGFTIDGINGKITWRLYNSYTESSTYGEFYPGAELRIADADWTIGCEQGATTGTAASAFYGYIDEVVVFNRLLNILEIDAIRQGTYSGTGKEGIAADHIDAQIAYRTVDRQTYFCIDPETGYDTMNDGLSYQRPWRTNKGRFFAPGDVITFPSTTKYAQAGTATVVTGSLTVTTSQNLMCALVYAHVVSFGDDPTLYSIKSITSTTITLYRPYRGTSGTFVIYKNSGTLFDPFSWNSGNFSGYPDQRIKLLGGVNRVTGEQSGEYFIFDHGGSYGTIDDESYMYYSKFGFLRNTGSDLYFYGKGCLLEDIYFGYANGSCFYLTQMFQTTWNRLIVECHAYVNLVTATDCVFNDLEMFVSSSNNLVLNNLKNIIFNQFRTGNSANGLYLNSPLRDITFYNPVFDEGTPHSYEMYTNASPPYFYENITFVNASLNVSTPKFYSDNTTNVIVGEISYEHYNQTKDDNRTYIFTGFPTGTYQGIMYRDTVTFRTSSPSVRIDLTGAGQMPLTRKFLVPAVAGIATTISCYVRFNTAYMSNYYTLPKMGVRTISGTIPNYVWTETQVTAPATADTWLLLTQTVTPSITGVLEVFLYFQSINTSAQCWFDDFDVVVPE
jgi:hypothetical protein